MSIFDTLWVIFKGDTTDLEKKQQNVTKNTKETEEAVKSAQRSTQGLSLSFVDMAEQAAKALAAVVSVGAATSAAINAEKNVQALGRFSKAIGVNITDLAAWDREIKNIAGDSASIEPIVSSLVGELNRSVGIAGTKLVSLPINAFTSDLGRNGIALLDSENRVRSWSDILLQEMRKIEDLRKQGYTEQQIGIFSKEQLHNDQATTLLILNGARKTEQELEDIRKRGLPTEEDYHRLERFGQAWGAVEQNAQTFFRNIAGPALEFFLDLPTLIDKNRKAFDDLISTIKLVGVAIGVLLIPEIVAALIAAAPLLLLVAAFGALYLIVSRFGNSKIGEWFHELGNTLSWVLGYVDRFTKAMASLVNGGGLKGAWHLLTDGADKGAGPQKESYNTQSQQDMIRTAKATIDLATQNPISAQTNNSVVNRASSLQNSVSIGQVTIQTQATDADGIAQTFGESLNKMFSQTIFHHADGVNA